MSGGAGADCRAERRPARALSCATVQTISDSNRPKYSEGRGAFVVAYDAGHTPVGCGAVCDRERGRGDKANVHLCRSARTGIARRMLDALEHEARWNRRDEDALNRRPRPPVALIQKPDTSPPQSAKYHRTLSLRNALIDRGDPRALRSRPQLLMPCSMRSANSRSR